MLKMREPIKLKSNLHPILASDSFYHRINGNYGIMNARIAPKDLLFLLTQSYEFPEEMFGQKQFSINNNITDARRITVDVVNNLINRILLSSASDFTYQDRVYITAILNKLGVNDVKQFMKEIRRIREEQSSSLELTKLYRSEINRVVKSAKIAFSNQNTISVSSKSGEEKSVSPVFERHLHQQIYDILENNINYNRAADVNNNVFSNSTDITRNDLRLYKLIKTSLNNSLNETNRISKETNLLFSNQSASHAAKNGSEEKPVLPAPRYYLHQQIYDRLETADIYREINNIHSGFTAQSNNITHTELNLAEQLRVSRDIYLTELKKSYFQSYSPTMQHHINRYEQGDILPPPATEDEVISQAAQAALFSTVERIVTQTIAQNTDSRSYWLNINNSLRQTAENSIKRFESFHNHSAASYQFSQSYNDRRRNIINEEKNALLLLKKFDIEAPQPENIKTDAPHQVEAFSPSSVEKQTLILNRRFELESRLNQLSELEREMTVMQEQERIKTVLEPQLSRERMSEINTLSETLRRKTERHTQSAEKIRESFSYAEREILSPEQQNIENPISEAPQPASVESTELIARELREIDRQNRERLERIQTIQRQISSPARLTPPDPAKTMRQALRALNDPQSVLNEITEHRQTQTSLRETSAVEKILAHTDSTTRQLLETVMNYQRDPQAALESGIVKLNNIGELNAVSAAKQTPAAAIEHIKLNDLSEQQQETAQYSTKALERFTEQPQTRIPQPKQPHRHYETPIVFRRENNNAVEELIERLEEQRTTSVLQQNTHEDVIHNNTSQTEIHNHTSKITAQTTEDITEIINRQMARQMNVITDQVYRQMERKLQNERTRRGRF